MEGLNKAQKSLSAGRGHAGEGGAFTPKPLDRKCPGFVSVLLVEPAVINVSFITFHMNNSA